jgi:hypothetical protein
MGARENFFRLSKQLDQHDCRRWLLESTWRPVPELADVDPPNVNASPTVVHGTIPRHATLEDTHVAHALSLTSGRRSRESETMDWRELSESGESMSNSGMVTCLVFLSLVSSINLSQMSLADNAGSMTRVSMLMLTQQITSGQ